MAPPTTPIMGSAMAASGSRRIVVPTMPNTTKPASAPIAPQTMFSTPRILMCCFVSASVQCAYFFAGSPRATPARIVCGHNHSTEMAFGLFRAVEKIRS